MSDKADNNPNLKGVDLEIVTITCEDFSVSVSGRGYAIPRSKSAPIRRYGVYLHDKSDYVLNIETESGFDAAIRVVAHWAEDIYEPEPFLALESESSSKKHLVKQLRALEGQRIRLLFRKKKRG